jgi:hypothetical protein
VTEECARLPLADDRSELLADGWDRQQGRFVQACELGQILAVSQQVEEPKVLALSALTVENSYPYDAHGIYGG